MSIKTLAPLLAVIAATCVGAETAHAQARLWVSGTGSDSNPCSRTQPCLTFAGALALVQAGGEINCLDPGGFGAVTITIPVTINCEGVSYGGISVFGTTAITVNASGPVNLIGLDINGENNPSSTQGVLIQGTGVVNIRNCKIYGFTNGLGIYFQPGSSGGTLIVDNVLISGGYVGIGEYGHVGVSNMTVRNSNINNNVNGIIVQQTGGTHAGATVEQTTLSFNQYGLWVYGAGAVAVLGSTTVVNNASMGVFSGSGGIVYSFKNNQIGGNSSDGTPLTAYPGGPLN